MNSYSKTESDAKFVSVKDCTDKKQKFIDRDLCEAKESAIKDDVGEIKEDIRLIKENHLAHMQASLSAMEKEISDLKIKVALITGGVTIIIDLVFRFVFK